MPLEAKLLFNIGTQPVYLFTFWNKRGTSVRITNYGAIITSYRVNISGERTTDIVVGFDDINQYFSTGYLNNYPYLGAAIGRYANQIKEGSFYLHERKIQLTKNLELDHLHGGMNGFDRKIWDWIDSTNTDTPSVTLGYLSTAGDENYPGNVDVKIIFSLNDEDEFQYEYHATTDADTIINLTHHSYFNLNGNNESIASHWLKIYGSNYLGQDERLNSDGRILPVKDTRFDFLSNREILFPSDTHPTYDQSYILDKHTDEMATAAEVWSPDQRLHLSIATTEPVIHLYTATDLSVENAKGRKYGPYSALCLETQKHPNAINIPHFPNTILTPGEIYHTKTIYKTFRHYHGEKKVPRGGL